MSLDLDQEFRHFREMEGERIRKEVVNDWENDPEITGPVNSWLRFALAQADEMLCSQFEKQIKNRVAKLSDKERAELLDGFAEALEEELEDDFVEFRAHNAAEKLLILELVKSIA